MWHDWGATSRVEKNEPWIKSSLNELLRILGDSWMN